MCTTGPIYPNASFARMQGTSTVKEPPPQHNEMNIKSNFTLNALEKYSLRLTSGSKCVACGAKLNCTTGLPHGSEFEIPVPYFNNMSSCRVKTAGRGANHKQNSASWYHSQAWPRSISAGLVYKWWYHWRPLEGALLFLAPFRSFFFFSFIACFVFPWGLTIVPQAVLWGLYSKYSLRKP